MFSTSFKIFTTLVEEKLITNLSTTTHNTVQ